MIERLIHTQDIKITFRTSLVAQKVKNLLAMQETWVQSLGWEDPLEEGMATQLQCSFLENPHEQRSLAGYVLGVTKRQTRLSD